MADTPAARRGWGCVNDIIFLYLFQHEWTLINTYKVHISPIDMSSEERNNDTNKTHKFMCYEQ